MIEGGNFGALWRGEGFGSGRGSPTAPTLEGQRVLDTALGCREINPAAVPGSLRNGLSVIKPPGKR